MAAGSAAASLGLELGFEGEVGAGAGFLGARSKVREAATDADAGWRRPHSDGETGDAIGYVVAEVGTFIRTHSKPPPAGGSGRPRAHQQRRRGNACADDGDRPCQRDAGRANESARHPGD